LALELSVAFEFLALIKSPDLTLFPSKKPVKAPRVRLLSSSGAFLFFFSSSLASCCRGTRQVLFDLSRSAEEK